MNRNNVHHRLAGPGVLAIVLSMSIALPQLAGAQNPGMRAGGGALANNPAVRLWNALDQRFDGFTGELGLTEAQAGSVAALVEKFREQNRVALSRYDGMMTQMRNRMRGGTRGGAARGGGARPNRQGMRAGGGFADIIEELVPAFETLHQDVATILDEGQVEKLNGLLARRRPGN